MTQLNGNDSNTSAKSTELSGLSVSCDCILIYYKMGRGRGLPIPSLLKRNDRPFGAKLCVNRNDFALQGFFHFRDMSVSPRAQREYFQLRIQSKCIHERAIDGGIPE